MAISLKRVALGIILADARLKRTERQRQMGRLLWCEVEFNNGIGWVTYLQGPELQAIKMAPPKSRCQIIVLLHLVDGSLTGKAPEPPGPFSTV